MKYIILLQFALLFCHTTIAQNTEEKARKLYYQALEDFESHDYYGCIYKVRQVIELLGSTKPKLERLLAESYLAENRSDETIEKHLIKYVEISSEKDEHYNDMIELLAKIAVNKRDYVEKKLTEKRIKENELKIEREQSEAWLKAQRLDISHSYRDFLIKYPQGKYSALATKRLNYRVDYEQEKRYLKRHLTKALIEVPILTYTILRAIDTHDTGQEWLDKAPYGFGFAKKDESSFEFQEYERYQDMHLRNLLGSFIVGLLLMYDCTFGVETAKNLKRMKRKQGNYYSYLNLENKGSGIALVLHF